MWYFNFQNLGNHTAEILLETTCSNGKILVCASDPGSIPGAVKTWQCEFLNK